MDASRQRIKDRYTAFTAIPGEFGPEFSGDLRTSIDSQLSQNGIDMGDLREKPSGILPSAQMGIAEIDRVIKNLESGRTVSAVQINDAAKTLNTLYKGAVGYDRELLNSLRHGFYDAVKDISNSNFSGDQAALSGAFKSARSAHETHANTFMGESEIGTAARDVNRGNLSNASTSLGNLIIDPRTGRMMPGADEIMTRLNDIGMGHGVNEHVRSTIANVVADPNVPHLTSSEAINNPLLYADEAERLRALNATKGVIGEAPPPSGEWTPGRAARLATGAVAGGLTGLLARDLPVLGPLAVPVAGYIGGRLENTVERGVINPMERAAELRGAPVERRPFTPLRSDGSALEAAVNGILGGTQSAAQYVARQGSMEGERQPEPVQMSTEELLAEPTGEGDQRVTPDAPRGGPAPVPSHGTNPLLAEPTGEGDEIVMPDAPEPHFAGGRVGRASGGQVGDSRKHEFLVNRLMLAAKNAKKVTDKTTEPLLNVPDEHIVKALDVAQRAI
jgi:hypothetical protein